jgi:holo-[acyl-carrier protein] synthase
VKALVLGVGVDIVEIERIKRLLARHGPRFLRRLFTGREIEYCLAKARPAAHLAVRFAAKEAVMKALGLGLGECRWVDIEVSRDARGGPTVSLSGEAGSRADCLGVISWHLSMAHSRDYAVAVAVGEGARTGESGDRGGNGQS